MSNRGEDLQRYAELVRGQVDKTVRDNVEAIRQENIKRNKEKYGCPNCDLAECYKTCPRYLTNAEPEILWSWWRKTSPVDRREKEPLQHIPAPPAKKGGSKSGKKRKDPPKFYANPYLCG